MVSHAYFLGYHLRSFIGNIQGGTYGTLHKKQYIKTESSFHRASCSRVIFLLSSPFADMLDEFKEMNKGVWKKLQEKFAPGNPEEKHKAWARALSSPRT